jgi:hypothetical protein|tara:strand:- start:522 stop:641 length:120 start_codon:yes stop_codon:yes gene_type:complete
MKEDEEIKEKLSLLKQWELIDIIVDMEKQIECLKKKLKK